MYSIAHFIISTDYNFRRGTLILYKYEYFIEGLMILKASFKKKLQRLSIAVYLIVLSSLLFHCL